jgi:hypothetical protein
MSPDVLLKVIGYAVIPLVMAWIGNSLASEAIQDPKRRRWYKGAFIGLVVIGLVVTWLVEWRSDETHTKEVADNKDTLVHVQELLMATKVQSAQDMGYLKGRLDAAIDRPQPPQPDMQKLATAIAASSAALIQAQIKAQSDTELKTQATQLAKDMRAFESGYDMRLRANVMNRGPYSPTMTEADRNSQFQRETAAMLQLMEQEKLEFRNNFLVRAINVKGRADRKTGKISVA